MFQLINIASSLLWYIILLCICTTNNQIVHKAYLVGLLLHKRLHVGKFNLILFPF